MEGPRFLVAAHPDVGKAAGVSLREAAEAVASRAQLVPMQLTDERGATIGFSTYACVEVPLMDALIAALDEPSAEDGGKQSRETETSD